MPVTYKLIATTTVSTATAADITFSNIPATYDDLVLKISSRGNAAALVVTGLILFNGSDTDFSSRFAEGNGAAVSSYTGLNYYGPITGNNATASTFGNDEVYIPNYAGSTNKSFSADVVTENNGTTAYQALGAGLRSNTAAITSVTIKPASGSFLQYSSASLYGIKKS